MRPFAQTNVQLYNELREQGRGPEAFALARRCYDFSSIAYSGHYQADGKPFVCHCVGVASIVAALGLPDEFVGAALLHNVYGNGDFGDDQAHVVTPRRRQRLTEAVGEPVARLAERFRRFRVSPATLSALEEGLPGLDETDRNLLTLDLTDHLEKHLDLGVLYYGDGSWVTEVSHAHGPRLIALAARLGRPELADMLAEAFAEVRRAADVPDPLRGQSGQRYLQVVVPPSWRRRMAPELTRRFRARAASLRRRIARWRAAHG